MSKHTSGPWEYKPSAKTTLPRLVGEGRILAIFKNEPNPANAHLIAAAPDMYEALKNMYHAFQDGYDCTFDAKMSDAIQDAYVAFTKAEGKQL